MAKYNFSLEYQKGKNNTVADALIRISDKCFSDEEAEKVLEAVPVIPGDNTMFKVYEEEDEDRWPEKTAPYAMLSWAMKAIFDNLTSGAGRRAEHEASFIEVNVISARLSTQLLKLNGRTQRSKPQWTGVTSTRRN